MRVLLISSDVPVTSSMPGSPRAFCLFRHLARSHEIHLATFVSSLDRYETFLESEESSKVFRSVTNLRIPPITSFWGRQRHRLVQAPYFVTRYRSPAEFLQLRRRISELVEHNRPDLVFADGLMAAQYILHLRGIPRVVDATDAISLNFRRASSHVDSRWDRLRLLLEARSVRGFEVETARAVDGYLVCSPIDQEALQSYHRDVIVRCIPNGVDTEYFAPDDQASVEKTIVFTGVMGYGPNRDAAHFLCSEILPRIRRVISEVQVHLVGSDPPDDVCALAGNGVTVTGTVPDVRPYMHRAAVCVSPLRFGTGVKNKVLAALAMGKAVVATRESCAGLDVTPGKHLLVADNPDDFAAHVVRLFADPNRRVQLGNAGRSLVVERYGWDAMGQQLEALLHSLVFPSERPQQIPERSTSGGTRGT